jgi:histidine triad (HIT) family protein
MWSAWIDPNIILPYNIWARERQYDSRIEKARMSPTYDSQNIFAKILRGEAPCVRLYEDEAAFAFMDIMPRADGHLLVVPKTPARNILDVSPQALAAMMPAVQKLALAAKAALGADGVSVLQFNETAGGQVVFHLHFHVIPRVEGISLKPPGGPVVPTETLEPFAAKIRAALSRG